MDGFAGTRAAWVPATRRATKAGEVVPRVVLMSGLLWISGYDWAVEVWHDVAPDRLRIYTSGDPTKAEEWIEPLIMNGDTVWSQLLEEWEQDQQILRRWGAGRKLRGSKPKTPTKRLHPRASAPGR